MCGILGKITFQGEHESPEIFERALCQLDHRGPDDRGAHHGVTVDGAQISLGQTRLSILDLSDAGHQPMQSPRSGAWMVYNGEAYNFREVREELRKSGLQFQSECDTEVLLAAYDHIGEEFIEPFHGMFAICIWDVKENRVVLLRDRLGIKPLYYYWDGRQFAFASEITALAALPTLKLEVSQYAIRQFLMRGFIPHPLSIYENVWKLPAGHRLTLDLARPRPSPVRYWDSLDYYAKPCEFRDEREVLDAIDTRLRHAVKLRLVSDVPLGAFLSGGVDSSLVVAMMQQVHSGIVKTFSIGFSEDRWNEAPTAKRIAQHLGTEHEEIYLTEENILDAARTASDHYDEPFADPSCIPTLELSRLTRRFVTVALSGDGGDELFWGYTTYDSRGLRWFRRASLLPYSIRTGFAAPLRLFNENLLERIGHQLAFRDLSDFFMGTAMWHPWLYHELQREKITGSRFVEIGRRVMDRLPGAPIDLLTGAFDLQSYLVDDILTKVDRASMSVALEARVPILDHKVVELAASIPVRFKTAGREQKHLLRALLTRYLPRELWERPKMGFGVPLVHWLRTSLRDWAREELLGDRSNLHQWLSRSELERMFDDHLLGRRNVADLIWACLQLSGWDRRMTHIRSSNCPRRTAEVSA
jgi:asparagine synthase (glutamine-hydrolysing)